MEIKKVGLVLMTESLVEWEWEGEKEVGRKKGRQIEKKERRGQLERGGRSRGTKHKKAQGGS